MHPEIEKFWEDAGYELGIVHPQTRIQIGWKRDEDLIETLACGGLYAFNKEWYSEEEMLRIIRIKAFL